MMKKILKYKIFGLALLLMGLASCDQASQDASPVVEPNDSYPMVTYTPATNTTIGENDTIVLFTITTNRPIDRSLTFRATQTGGTASSDDYTIINAVIQPYTTEAELIMITNEGWQGESTETADFLVRMTSLADKYLLNPDATQSATISVTINNTPKEVTVHSDMSETTKDGVVSIYFDGDVTFVDGKKITLHDRYYSSAWADVIVDAASELVFENGEFIIDHPDFVEWTTIRMTIDSGAFVDAQGNVNDLTVIDFDIPFVMASYAGTYQLTSDDGFGPYTDIVEVEVLDAENYSLAVPDGDGLVDYLELNFDLDNYKVSMTDVRTNYYLNFWAGDGYYIETSAYWAYSDVLESSQLVLRDYGQGNGYFDEIAFEYGFVYEVYGDLLRGDGSYGTNGVVWSWEMAFTPENATKKSEITLNRSTNKFKIVDEVFRNGAKAYKVDKL